MRTKKRLLAILLALALALSLLPGAALASNDTSTDSSTDGTQVGGSDSGEESGGSGEQGGDTGSGSGEQGGSTGSGEQGGGTGSGEQGGNTGSGEQGGGTGSGEQGGGTGSGEQGGGTGSGEQGGSTGSGEQGGSTGSGNQGGNTGTTPEKEVTVTLSNPTASFSQKGRDIEVTYSISSNPSLSSLLSSTFFSSIQISLTVGSAAPQTKTLTGSQIGSICTFKDAVPIAQSAGASPLSVSLSVVFNSTGSILLDGTRYTIQGNDSRAAMTGTCTPVASTDPEKAVEDACKPVSISYNHKTGALSWSISPTYENNVKPGSTTKIDQSNNQRFILTLKRGSTVVESNIYFDTVSTSSRDNKLTRSQNSFSAVYKPAKTLEPGSYTIQLENERGSGLTGTCTFTVSEDAAPTTVKAALEKLLKDGFTSSSKASDIRNTILNAASGTSTASKLKNLATSLQANTTAAQDLVDLVREVEQKFTRAVGVTVSRKSASGLGTSISSVTGLGLNTASGTQITLSAAEAGRNYDTPSGARAAQFFSLSVSGLSDNKNLDFPVQVAMKLPDSFNTTDKIYVLHYTSASSPEKLDAYLSGGNAVFTTTSFSDFALVQENTGGYAVTVSASTNGAVTADKKEAVKGSTVTLTVKPDAGYAMGAMVITGKDGKTTVAAVRQSDTQYTFVMPDTDVTVQTVFIASQAPSFSDVPANHTFHKEISWIAQKGIMNGTGNGRFTPGGNVNRQQLWMVLGRMAGASPANMAEARTWAMNNGISDGTNPTGAVSRQQLVTMLCRYAEKQNLSLSGAADLSTYPDSGAVSSYARDALAWAVGNGIVGGTSDGRLNPTGSATRAHFAAFLYRFGQKTGM